MHQCLFELTFHEPCHRESDALDLVQLYMLSYPNSSFCTNLPSPPPTGLDLVKVSFYQYAMIINRILNFAEIL